MKFTYTVIGCLVVGKSPTYMVLDNYLSKKSSNLGVFFRHVVPSIHDFGILDKSEEMEGMLTRVLPFQVMRPSFNVELISPTLLYLVYSCVCHCVSG